MLVNNKCLSIYPCIADNIPLVPFLRARNPYDSSFSGSLNTNPVRSHSPLGGVSQAPNTVNRNALNQNKTNKLYSWLRCIFNKSLPKTNCTDREQYVNRHSQVLMDSITPLLIYLKKIRRNILVLGFLYSCLLTL